MSNSKVTKVFSGVDEATETGELEAIVKKEAVNVLDLLLGSDIGAIKKPQKEVEVHRLSEVFRAPFLVVCEAISPDKYEEVQDLAIMVKGKDVDIDMNLLQLFIVIEGVKNQNGQLLFKSKELMEKFKVPTPKELCRKLLLSGEITSLYSIISHLSGFGDDAVSEIKN